MLRFVSGLHSICHGRIGRVYCGRCSTRCRSQQTPDQAQPDASRVVNGRFVVVKFDDPDLWDSSGTLTQGDRFAYLGERRLLVGRDILSCCQNRSVRATVSLLVECNGVILDAWTMTQLAVPLGLSICWFQAGEWSTKSLGGNNGTATTLF